VVVAPEPDPAEDPETVVVDVDTALLVEFAARALAEPLAGVDLAAGQDPLVYRRLLDQQEFAGRPVRQRVGAEGQSLALDALGDRPEARPGDPPGRLVLQVVPVVVVQTVVHLFGLLAGLVREEPQVVDRSHGPRWILSGSLTFGPRVSLVISASWRGDPISVEHRPVRRRPGTAVAAGSTTTV
jgi:hypothetical protein